jgi:hypothetical protein
LSPPISALSRLIHLRADKHRGYFLPRNAG